MRNAHFLSRSKGERRPRDIVFFDTETNIKSYKDGSELHTLKLGNALYCHLSGLSSLTIEESKDFCDYHTFNNWIALLANRCDKLHVVSHNIVYDIAATHSLVELPKRGYRLSTLYSKATTTLISLRANKRVIWLLDNSNFFVGKLEKLGNLVGLPKLDIDFEKCTPQELMVYCRRDVEIIYRLWQLWFQFLETNDIGNFKMTTSSTAFEAYRHRFIPHTIAIHNDKEVINLEREAYHGGRVEVKYLGYYSGRCYYLDVNSMYPFVMSTYQYPYRLYRYSEQIQNSTIERWLHKYSVIAKIKLKTEVNAYPAIVNGKLVYPVGEFITTLSTPELKHAIDNAEIVEVYGAAYYGQYPLFREYVDYFYKARLRYRAEENKPFEQIAKLMGNGLYGKFGQKEIIQKILCENDPELVRTVYGYDIPTDTRYIDNTLGGVTIRSTEGLVAYNAFPAIASHVTAYARMYLWSLIEKVPSGHFFYSDTDSLIVDNIGYNALLDHLDDNRLGGLKIERSSSWLGVAAPKVYNMQGRFRIKGISKEANIVDVNTWKQKRWPKLGSMMSQYGVEDYRLFSQRKTLTFANEQVNVSSSSPWTSPVRLTVREGENFRIE